MKDILLIFFGGGFGSVVRYSLGRWIGTFHQQNFPWGTFAVNVTACLVLGFVIGLADHKLISPTSRLFWTVGFCGGFSTFSTFSQETLTLLQGGFSSTALLYVAMSLIVCIAASMSGIYAGMRVGE